MMATIRFGCLIKIHRNNYVNDFQLGISRLYNYVLRCVSVCVCFSAQFRNVLDACARARVHTIHFPKVCLHKFTYESCQLKVLYDTTYIS